MEEMEEKYVSRGTFVAFPLSPDASGNNTTATIEHVADNSQGVKKKNLANYSDGANVVVTDAIESESESGDIIYRFVSPHIEHYPSVIQLEKVKRCHRRHAREAQSNCCIYRNSNFPPANPGYHPSSFHHGYQIPNHAIPQSSHVEEGVPGDGGESCSSESDLAGGQTIWSKIRRVFGFLRRESSMRFQQLNNAINVQELLVYGLKKYDKLSSKRSSSNMHVIKVKFPNLNITAKYEFNNWTFLSRKFTGGGKMNLTLNNVQAKIVISTIKEVENVKMMTPDFQMKASSGWIHFSELNGYDNTLLNRNFKQTLKALAPSINEIVSKKIIEKYSFVPNLFNDAF